MLSTRTLLGIPLQFGFRLLRARKQAELRSPRQVILLQLLGYYEKAVTPTPVWASERREARAWHLLLPPSTSALWRCLVSA